MSRQGVLASECLQKGCPPPSNMLIKKFARWYCKSRRGRLAPTPNIKSVKTTLKGFLPVPYMIMYHFVTKHIFAPKSHWVKCLLVSLQRPHGPYGIGLSAAFSTSSRAGRQVTAAYNRIYIAHWTTLESAKSSKLWYGVPGLEKVVQNSNISQCPL